MNSDVRTYGGGGAGGFSGSASSVGGSGGGMSAIFQGSTPLLIAGGGGGASPGAEPDTSVVAGGGGGSQGGDGTYADVSGQGGTQLAGGAAALNPGNAANCEDSGSDHLGQPQDGSQYQGGDGGGQSGATEGGGGGYYGGGGGSCQALNAPGNNGDGGGGSGFIATVNEGVSNAAMTAGQNSPSNGAGGEPGNTTSANYPASLEIGQGGWTENGGDGLVVLQWVVPTATTSTPTTVSPTASTAAMSSLAKTGFPFASAVSLSMMLASIGSAIWIQVAPRRSQKTAGRSQEASW